MENKEIRLINLRQLLAEAKTAASLAYAANTSPSYISQILSLKSKGSIGNRLARRLEAAAGKAKGWLDTIHHDEKQKPEQLLQCIPLIDLDRVFEWCQGKKWMANKVISAITDDEQAFGENIFSITMVGDAMRSNADISSSICHGDIVIIDPDLKPSYGDVLLVKIKQSPKIRQWTIDGDEQILKALNPQYPIIPFSAATKILGVVVEIRRKMKKRNRLSIEKLRKRPELKM